MKIPKIIRCYFLPATFAVVIAAHLSSLSAIAGDGGSTAAEKIKFKLSKTEAELLERELYSRILAGEYPRSKELLAVIANRLTLMRVAAIFSMDGGRSWLYILESPRTLPVIDIATPPIAISTYSGKIKKWQSIASNTNGLIALSFEGSILSLRAKANWVNRIVEASYRYENGSLREVTYELTSMAESPQYIFPPISLDSLAK